MQRNFNVRLIARAWRKSMKSRDVKANDFFQLSEGVSWIIITLSTTFCRLHVIHSSHIIEEIRHTMSFAFRLSQRVKWSENSEDRCFISSEYRGANKLMIKFHRSTTGSIGVIVILTLANYITYMLLLVNWYVRALSRMRRKFSPYLSENYVPLKIYLRRAKFLNIIASFRRLSLAFDFGFCYNEHMELTRTTITRRREGRNVSLNDTIRSDKEWKLFFRDTLRGNWVKFSVVYVDVIAAFSPSSTTSWVVSRIASCSPSLSPFNSIFYFSEWLL